MLFMLFHDLQCRWSTGSSKACRHFETHARAFVRACDDGSISFDARGDDRDNLPRFFLRTCGDAGYCLTSCFKKNETNTIFLSFLIICTLEELSFMLASTYDSVYMPLLSTSWTESVFLKIGLHRASERLLSKLSSLHHNSAFCEIQCQKPATCAKTTESTGWSHFPLWFSCKFQSYDMMYFREVWFQVV